NNSRSDYVTTGSGVNEQGNHYGNRDYGASGRSPSAIIYSKDDGSYYYSNPNGSTYYNNGQGGSRYNSGK
ncbi:uncharacterized protein K452DRAFT_241921, partial [Aplosporella prunicola CBS 121167]